MTFVESSEWSEVYWQVSEFKQTIVIIKVFVNANLVEMRSFLFEEVLEAHFKLRGKFLFDH